MANIGEKRKRVTTQPVKEPARIPEREPARTPAKTPDRELAPAR